MDDNPPWDCDDFRKKRAEILASAAMLPADTPAAERQRLRESMHRDLLATLVFGWSLEDEFSRDNLMALLENAPYLADWIDRTSENASLFRQQLDRLVGHCRTEATLERPPAGPDGETGDRTSPRPPEQRLKQTGRKPRLTHRRYRPIWPTWQERYCAIKRGSA